MEEQDNGNGRRVLLFPLPFQGHINPMFQLASVLHSRGFAITILHTSFNSPNPSRHPDYHFVLLDPDCAADEVAKSSKDVVDVIFGLDAYVAAKLGDCLGAVSSEVRDVACLVIDSHLRSTQLASLQLCVPTLALRTGSAACFNVMAAFPMLREKGYLPRQESKLDVEVTELPPFRVRDILYLPEITHDRTNECMARIVNAARSSSGLILNTFDALENAEVEKIQLENSVPVFTIGPLHKFASSASESSSLLVQDRSCLEWLDKQDAHSVLYVSFGSLASMEPEELLEIAWGLASSGCPFIWVLRPDIVCGSKQFDLPDEFKEEIQDRGRLVSWAPQQEVLAHSAVGGFWTHNGWNSTLEGLCEGVPMICRPKFGDQTINARCVCEVWKVGFELEGKLERKEIERAIKRLMNEQEGREIRERSINLKKKATECMQSGGSFTIAIDKLVNHILMM